MKTSTARAGACAPSAQSPSAYAPSAYAPSPYAPGSSGTGTSDPVRLATMIVRAVDEVGNATAAGFEQVATAIEAASHEEAERMRAYAAELTRETEKGAAAIEAGAKQEADRLRQLAAATRGRSSLESERAAEYCTMSKTVLEGIRALEVQIAGRCEPEVDDGAEVPRFLKKGPANLAAGAATAAGAASATSAAGELPDAVLN